MNMQKPVRVRFAPSPTGYLHIGGARTALFNFLFARHQRGQFLIRIEDTDVARSQHEMTEAIFNSLRWLGLNWDEEPVYQSDHIQRYREVCQDLLERDKAYYCFCTPEELEERRQLVQREKMEYRYNRKCLSLSKDIIEEKLKKGVPRTVRFRVPEGQTTFHDLIHGEITVQHKEIDDFILLRSDAQPVYHIGVVVDDHDMEITHIIRGDDHLSNTPKQILLYEALGWDVPVLAHVPLILGPDKKRLSKRHGATSVEAYKEKGYLPDTLLNFIALLGWAPKNDEEILSLNSLIERFSIEGINKKSAVFDEKKLLWMNGVYMRSKKPEELYNAVLDVLHSKALIHENQDSSDVLKYIDLMKDRVRTLQEFASAGNYFFKDPSEYDAKGVTAHWNKVDILELFNIIKSRFALIKQWNTQTLEQFMRGFTEERNVSIGEVMHPLRLALTGMTASPGLFDIMVFLGKDTVIRRMENAIKYLELKSESQA